MPTYEYRCKDCGNELDVVQSFTDDALTTCDVCGGSLRKVFGNVGISFKGSGFYKNDSRKKSTTTTPAKTTAESGSGSSSSDTSTASPSSGPESTKTSDAPKPAEKSSTKKADSGSKTT